MQFSFYNTDISFTKSMQSYAKSKLSVLDKYEDIKPSTPVKVTLEKSDDQIKKLKIIVRQRKKSIIAETSDVDYYAAVDRAVDILERQIRHVKEKRIEKYRKANYFKEILDPETGLSEAIPTKEAQKLLRKLEKQQNAVDGQVVKEKYIFLDEMSQEEAIKQMLELHHDFFVYNDDVLKKTCVLYVRYDGNFGLLICN